MQTRPQPKQTPHGATLYVVGNIVKNKAEHIQVAVRQFGMNWYLDLRVFTSLPGQVQPFEERRPSKEGLTIPFGQFTEFVKMVKESLELMRELGVEDLHRLSDESGNVLESLLSGGTDGRLSQDIPSHVER